MFVFDFVNCPLQAYNIMIELDKKMWKYIVRYKNKFNNECTLRYIISGLLSLIVDHVSTV